MCQLEDLLFRNIVDRYFRIYGKENLNERKPIQYFEKETVAMSISALLKLFDKHKALKTFEVQIEGLKSERTTLVDAAKKDLIPHVVIKTLFGKNEKKIIELTEQLELLKKDIVTAPVTKKNGLANRLIKTQTNLKDKNINIQTESNQFVHYFPNLNIERVQGVDRFHKTIT